MLKEFKVAFNQETQERVTADFQASAWARVKFGSFEDRSITDPTLKALSLRLPEGAWVAGGAFESLLRGDKPKDYDLFFRDEEAFNETLDILQEDDEDLDDDEKAAAGYHVAFPRDRAEIGGESVRFVELHCEDKPKIQLIKTMWYSSLEQVLHSFDFTATQMGLDQQEIVMNPMAALDIARKRLVLSRMTFPASTLRRMVKYTQKGYYVCPGSMQVIATATAEVLSKTPAANGIVYID